MPTTYDFGPERKAYAQLRPQYEDNECLFVPNNSHGLVGYVTFDRDAHRLKSAIEKLRMPEHTARYFNGDTVLWVMDASEERARALSELTGYHPVFVFEKHQDTRSRE